MVRKTRTIRPLLLNLPLLLLFLRTTISLPPAPPLPPPNGRRPKCLDGPYVGTGRLSFSGKIYSEGPLPTYSPRSKRRMTPARRRRGNEEEEEVEEEERRWNFRRPPLSLFFLLVIFRPPSPLLDMLLPKEEDGGKEGGGKGEIIQAVEGKKRIGIERKGKNTESFSSLVKGIFCRVLGQKTNLFLFSFPSL